MPFKSLYGQQGCDHEIQEVRIPIAVMAWTTSTSKIIPILIKYEDENGMLQTIKNFKINKIDQKKYFGEQCQVFYCQAVIDDVIRLFRVIYYYGESLKWEMII